MASLAGEAWQVELEVNSRFAAQALCHRGAEVFVLDMPTLREATFQADLVIWHRHDNRWTPVNGGLAPVPETTGVAVSPDGVAVGGVGGTCPMQYDGSAFLHTSGGPGTFGVPIQIGRSLPGSARQAYAAGSVQIQDRPVFVARLEGDLWETVTSPSPLPTIVHIAPGEKGLAVAGYRTPSGGGEIWEWTGIAWQPVGDPFEPAPPTGGGSNPSRIEALAWHEGRLYAGCAASTIGGQVRSNLVVWDGAQWQSPVPLQAPAYVLRSSGGRLYIGSQVPRRPASILAWDGEQAEELGAGLPEMTLTGFDMSDQGLLAAVGNVGAPGVSPIWFRRGAAWVPPEDWTSPGPATAQGCVWFGNDLYIAGNGATASNVESTALAIWHEPGVLLRTRLASDGTPVFRATGALPARFAWERGDRLGDWVPFATNALGNPGWVSDPLAASNSRFYRIREIAADAE
ncbi:MAG: hypothetical protein KF791_15375 [Verrucomicrobiae bacterium]|nr:hypothetical protein [Verrucomicrobiae bacterium]